MASGARLEIALFLVAAVFFTTGYGLSDSVRPSFELTAKSPDTVRVVTWNIGVGLEHDDDIPSAEKAEYVATILRTLDPDWVFLQEVRDSLQVRRIAEALGSDWTAVESGRDGRLIAGLHRSRSVRLRRGVGDDGCLAFRDRQLDCEVRILHADAFSAATRNDQIGRAVESLFESSGRKLLAGDLNLDLDLDKRRDLFSDDDYSDVETYNYTALRLQDAARGTGSTAEPDRRLDYVFVDARGFEVLDAGPWRGRRAPGMDHDPVVCDLVPR